MAKNLMNGNRPKVKYKSLCLQLVVTNICFDILVGRTALKKRKLAYLEEEYSSSHSFVNRPTTEENVEEPTESSEYLNKFKKCLY